MDKLVLCTTNPGKLAELKVLLPKGITLLSLSDVAIHHELPETGSTLEANALQKARVAWEQCGLPCLADDTGLEVHALDGAPGVLSARYAGSARDPQANMDKLLLAMADVRDRSARFRTVLALVQGNDEHLFHGEVGGHISTERIGSGGFGYDPIFVPEGRTRTFGEMTAAEKSCMSHRARATDALVRHLRAISTSSPPRS